MADARGCRPSRLRGLMRVCSRWARGGHEQAPQVRRAREARSAPLWRVGWRVEWEKGLPPIVNQEAGTPQAYQRSPAYALQKVRCQNGSSPFCTPVAREASWYMGAPLPLRYALTSTLTSTAPPTGMKSCSPHGKLVMPETRQKRSKVTESTKGDTKNTEETRHSSLAAYWCVVQEGQDQ